MCCDNDKHIIYTNYTEDKIRHTAAHVDPVLALRPPTREGSRGGGGLDLCKLYYRPLQWSWLSNRSVMCICIRTITSERTDL